MELVEILFTAEFQACIKIAHEIPSTAEVHISAFSDYINKT